MPQYHVEITKIIFNSEDFYIFKTKDDAFSVKGNSPFFHLVPGTPLIVEGELEANGQYGQTLKAKSMKLDLDLTSREDLDRLFRLKSCANLVSYVLRTDSQANPVEVLHEQQDVLLRWIELEDSDSLKARLLEAYQFWTVTMVSWSIQDEVKALGITERQSALLVARLGVQALDTIKADPTVLITVADMALSTADRICHRMGKTSRDPVRVAMWVYVFLLREIGMRGHVCYALNKLASGLSKFVVKERGDIIAQEDETTAALALLQGQNRVVCSLGKVYARSMYDLEVGVADKILQLHQQEIPDQESDVDAYLEGYAESNRVSFSQEQVLAVKNAILFPVSVVAGHPGTGKTFCTRAIVRYFQRQNKKIFLMAPTGIAAKRLEQVVGESATTIHRALRFNGEVFAHNEDSPLNADVVLIDETSMLGLPLLASLLAAIPSDARVIFVGDPAQLPSVEPGYVLSDMISSGVIAYSHLTQIYRQEEASDIILWAHAIHRGDSPDLRPPSQSDVVFLSSASDEEASQAIVNLVRSLHKKNSERDTPLTFQVLSPRYKGIAGVDDLNQRLRDLLNPAAKTQEIRIDGQVYRVNDRIMITKNDYKLDIFNGETGKIDSVNLRTKSLVVRIYDDPHPRHVELLFKDVPHKLTLAYAVTTHKFQGQEVDVILMPCVSSFGYQLERHLIYTGLTRAKKKAFIVGQWPSLLRAIQTNRTEDRQGALIERLSENLNH